jgi:hypothetical protein
MAMDLIGQFFASPVDLVTGGVGGIEWAAQSTRRQVALVSGAGRNIAARSHWASRRMAPAS